PKTLAFAPTLTSLPLVAIGGIDESNTEQVLAAAPCGLCVCSAVISHEDVAEATARLRHRIELARGVEGASGPS
ncbi:MAG: thiamine phosphate synthase, partial [Planctomycetes bacterium]|nr:thiamine phosphate synthase [Planctomycetota bacterium]